MRRMGPNIAEGCNSLLTNRGMYICSAIDVKFRTRHPTYKSKSKFNFKNKNLTFVNYLQPCYPNFSCELVISFYIKSNSLYP
jgi:hypothetical protein